MFKPIIFATALLCASFATHAAEPIASAGPPVRKLDGVLTDLKGRGLYIWDGDVVAGRSSCNNQCRILWPPIIAEDGAQPRPPFTLVMREDGRRQWALRGKPLYRWASDKKYGDAGGDKVSDTWHLVRTVPKAAAASVENKSR